MRMHRPSILRGGLLVSTLTLAAMASSSTRAASFTAGAGRADIALPAALFPIDGFVGQHDPLTARVLLLDDGTTRVAIATVDLTSMSAETIAAAKAILAQAAGVPPEDAIVCASHTFSAPHAMAPPDATPAEKDRKAGFAAAIDAALRSAAAAAAASLGPARVGAGAGASRVGVNRDVRSPAGWWLGADAAGFSDPTVSVLRVDGIDGRPRAVLFDAAVQPSVMDGAQDGPGGSLVTADLAGAAARTVEAHEGSGTVAMFLPGAGGDQAPLLMVDRHVVDGHGRASRTDIGAAGFAVLDLLGDRFGTDAARAADAVSTVPGAELHVLRGSAAVPSQLSSPRDPPRGPVASFAYRPGPTVAVPIVVVQIGDTALVGLQAELAAGVGADIRARSPFAHTIVATMVDGSAKYMANAAGYDRFTYEARNSPYGRGAAELTADRVLALLATLRQPAGVRP